MKKIIMLLLFGVFLSGPCYATPKEKIEELFVLVKMSAQLDEGYRKMIIPVICELNMSSADEEIFLRELIKIADFQTVKDKMIQFWADNYTEEELDQLIAFYKTDLGQKTLAMFPKYVQWVSVETVKWAQEKGHQIEELAEKMAEKYSPRSEEETKACWQSRLGLELDS